MSDFILANIQQWRQKAADGTITEQESLEALRAIRKERTAASVVSASSSRAKKAAEAGAEVTEPKPKKAKAVANGQTLLEGLFALAGKG